jgi:hypothetical protein
MGYFEQPQVEFAAMRLASVAVCPRNKKAAEGFLRPKQVVVRKGQMNLTCTYCGYNSLRIVRDYTGAPYASCPRCYRANPFYRIPASARPADNDAVPSQTARATPSRGASRSATRSAAE